MLIDCKLIKRYYMKIPRMHIVDTQNRDFFLSLHSFSTEIKLHLKNKHKRKAQDDLFPKQGSASDDFGKLAKFHALLFLIIYLIIIYTKYILYKIYFI